MLRVGKTPAVEWHEQEGMHDQTHRPVEFLRFRESAMSTLVCQNPDAGEDKALYRCVRCPGEKSEVGTGEQRDVGGSEVDEDRGVEKVSDDICHRAEYRRLEAVRRDSIVDLLHGEGW